MPIPLRTRRPPATSRTWGPTWAPASRKAFMGLCLALVGWGLFLPGAAHADEAPKSTLPPEITLTQQELQLLIQAEDTKAIAGYVAQQEGAKAQGVYDKIKQAFSPKGK